MAEKTMRALGKYFEGEAKKFLEKKKMRCIDRNYTCRGGEIDLVMRDGAYWVFVEVKARRSTAFGTPAAYVTVEKQRRLCIAAQKYMLENRIDAPCRFDVVEILYKVDEKETVADMKINHIVNAFVQEEGF